MAEGQIVRGPSIRVLTGLKTAAELRKAATPVGCRHCGALPDALCTIQGLRTDIPHLVRLFDAGAVVHITEDEFTALAIRYDETYPPVDAEVLE
jgi:hypothetical protein